MMYLISVIDDATGSASADEMAAIDAFNARPVDDGAWVFAGGLAHPSEATVIDGRRPEPLLTDGPFIESKEYIAGFWLIQTANRDTALALAIDGSRACNRRVELRSLLG